MSSFILTNLLYSLEPLCPFSASFYILLLYISIHKEINSLPFLFVLLLLSFNWSFGFFLYTGGYSYIYIRVIMPPGYDNEGTFGFWGATTWRDARDMTRQKDRVKTEGVRMPEDTLRLLLLLCENQGKIYLNYFWFRGWHQCWGL